LSIRALRLGTGIDPLTVRLQQNENAHTTRMITPVNLSGERDNKIKKFYYLALPTTQNIGPNHIRIDVSLMRYKQVTSFKVYLGNGAKSNTLSFIN
jgi:hypothetical protein